MVELSNVKPGDKVADLDSGDGRISIAFGKVGALVTGFELDATLAQTSRELIIQEKLENNVTILVKDFWDADLSTYDIVTVYPMPDIMKKLELKLQTELKKGAVVLTNYYPFPNWIDRGFKDKIYLYKK